MFEIIDENAPIRSQDIREEYAAVIGEELSRGQFSRVFRKLKGYDCVAVEGKTSGTMYRVAEIPGGVPEIPV